MKSTPVMHCKLKELIDSRGITPYKLSKETGISPLTIRNYSRNKTSAYDSRVLATLCTYLDIDIAELLEVSHHES
jgi:DNA-binding Xre family transcriptional regulator